MLECKKLTNAKRSGDIIIRTSYERTTPESAEQGDCSDRGWIDEDGEMFETVEDAIAWLQGQGACHPSDYPVCCSGRTWYSTEPECVNYRTAEYETRSYFLSGLSGADELTVYAAITI